MTNTELNVRKVGEGAVAQLGAAFGVDPLLTRDALKALGDKGGVSVVCTSEGMCVVKDDSSTL